MRTRQKTDSQCTVTRTKPKLFTEESTKNCTHGKDNTGQQGNPVYTNDWILYPEDSTTTKEVADNTTLKPTALMSNYPRHTTLVLRSVAYKDSTTKELTFKDASIQAIQRLKPPVPSRSLSPSSVKNDLFSETAKIPPSAPLLQRLPTPDLPDIGMECTWEYN